MLKLINNNQAELHSVNSNSETKSDTEILDAYSQAVIAATEKVSPSVVHIKVKKNQNSQRQRTNNNREFNGGGSGFIISSDGYYKK